MNLQQFVQKYKGKPSWARFFLTDALMQEWQAQGPAALLSAEVIPYLPGQFAREVKDALGKPIHFGVHKGKLASEAPVDYLWWMVGGMQEEKYRRFGFAELCNRGLVSAVAFDAVAGTYAVTIPGKTPHIVKRAWWVDHTGEPCFLGTEDRGMRKRVAAGILKDILQEGSRTVPVEAELEAAVVDAILTERMLVTQVVRSPIHDGSDCVDMDLELVGAGATMEKLLTLLTRMQAAGHSHMVALETRMNARIEDGTNAQSGAQQVFIKDVNLVAQIGVRLAPGRDYSDFAPGKLLLTLEDAGKVLQESLMSVYRDVEMGDVVVTAAAVADLLMHFKADLSAVAGDGTSAPNITTAAVSLFKEAIRYGERTEEGCHYLGCTWAFGVAEVKDNEADPNVKHPGGARKFVVLRGVQKLGVEAA